MSHGTVANGKYPDAVVVRTSSVTTDQAHHLCVAMLEHALSHTASNARSSLEHHNNCNASLRAAGLPSFEELHKLAGEWPPIARQPRVFPVGQVQA